MKAWTPWSVSTWSPRARRLAIIGALLTGAAGVAMLFASPASKPPEPPPKSLGNVLTAADPKALGLSAIAEELRLLKARLDHPPETTVPPATDRAADSELAALREELAQMRAEMAHLRVQREAQRRPEAPARPALPAPATLQIVDRDVTPSGAVATPEVSANNYLPAGTLITGRLLYGLDASTATAAIRNPQPVVVRVQHDAILPNRIRVDVRECFLTAGGFGELSSERVMLRAENLACIRTDGRVIDVKLEAVAVGEDGKVGLRGRLVSKQGRAIGLAALAGLAEGAGQALGPGPTVFGSGVRGDVVGDAGSQGLSSSLDRVAEFYLDKADRLSPVLEVASARVVTFALVAGVSLDLAAHRSAP